MRKLTHAIALGMSIALPASIITPIATSPTVFAVEATTQLGDAKSNIIATDKGNNIYEVSGSGTLDDGKVRSFLGSLPENSTFRLTSKVFAPKNSSHLFGGYWMGYRVTRVVKFEGFENLYTSKVTNMAGMFYAATIANPDVSNWDTSNVTDMSYMFSEATNANPNTSDWNTSNVTYMARMFQDATSANPDVSKWDTSNVTDMARMFYGASNANPDVSKWSTS
ncbi:MAG: BspA family leucine-rich repeat surface protein, partial [Corynebacterium sp.]|nr:BspA family leucine-rich repeat surface protein [Corynebacterium sp.]